MNMNTADADVGRMPKHVSVLGPGLRRGDEFEAVSGEARVITTPHGRAPQRRRRKIHQEIRRIETLDYSHRSPLCVPGRSEVGTADLAESRGLHRSSVQIPRSRAVGRNGNQIELVWFQAFSCVEDARLENQSDQAIKSRLA